MGKQRLYSATIPDFYLIRFQMISQWTWQRFRGGHSKIGVWLLGCFFPLPTHLARPEGLHLSKPKKGVGWRNNNSFGVQEGAVTTSGATSKEEFAKAFVLYVKRSEKCVQIGWLLAMKNLKKNSLLSPSGFLKILPGFSWNSPGTVVCTQKVPRPWMFHPHFTQYDPLILVESWRLDTFFEKFPTLFNERDCLTDTRLKTFFLVLPLFCNKHSKFLNVQF